MLFRSKSYPSGAQAEFAALSDDDQRAVEVGCTLLRLAECLDRGHMGAVTAARFEQGGKAKGKSSTRSNSKSERKGDGKSESKSEGNGNGHSEGKGKVTLRLEAAGDCRLELWGVHDRRKAFRRTFDRRLETEVVEGIAGSRAAK